MAADAALAAVTFDVGQTLTSLDTRMLAARVARMGGHVTVEALDAAMSAAWRVYDEAVRLGAVANTWKAFMSALLEGAGERPGLIEGLVEHLWREQPARNLWRRPVAGMIDLVDALRDAGVPVGIVSNSEGRVAELLEELGWLDRFAVVADSGRLGFEKPDPRIFAYACEALGVPAAQVVHIGDSRSADVEGALGVGMRAIWFRGATGEHIPTGARSCSTPSQVGEVLAEWGAPLSFP